VFVAVVGGHRSYGVGLFFKAGGSDTEVQGFVVTILCSGKLFCRGGPTLRQIEIDRSFGGAFDVAVNGHGQIEGLCAERNDSRLWSNGNGNSRASNERFEHEIGRASCRERE